MKKLLLAFILLSSLAVGQTSISSKSGVSLNPTNTYLPYRNGAIFSDSHFSQDNLHVYLRDSRKISSVNNFAYLYFGAGQFVDLTYNDGTNQGSLQHLPAKTLLYHSSKIEINSPVINLPTQTASRIPYIDSSKNLTALTIGSGLSLIGGTLSAGTLSATGSNIANSDLTSTASHTWNLNGYDQTINTVGDNFLTFMNSGNRRVKLGMYNNAGFLAVFKNDDTPLIQTYLESGVYNFKTFCPTTINSTLTVGGGSLINGSLTVNNSNSSFFQIQNQNVAATGAAGLNLTGSLTQLNMLVVGSANTDFASDYRNSAIFSRPYGGEGKGYIFLTAPTTPDFRVNYDNGLTGNSSTQFNVYQDIGVGIGMGATNPTAKLQIKGSGTTSATTCFKAQNSSGANLLTIPDDGHITINQTLSIKNLPNSDAGLSSGDLYTNAGVLMVVP